MQLLEIDGWQGSGKSLLWSLFDGSNSVFSSLSHEVFHYIFLNEPSALGLLTSGRMFEFRRLLTTTLHYKIEEMSLAGRRRQDFGGGSVLEIPCEFDFYEFEREFFTTAATAGIVSPSGACAHYYQLMRAQSRSASLPTSPAYCAVMGLSMGGQKDYLRLLAAFPKMKVLQVQRSPKEIIATRKNRASEQATIQGYGNSFGSAMRTFEYERIKLFHRRGAALEKLLPTRCKVVRFLDLLENTESTMRKIVEFLGIDYEDQLSLPSWNGVPLVLNGRTYLDSEYDSADQLLSARERAHLHKRDKFERVYISFCLLRQRLGKILTNHSR
ncbi:sulfotransferase [Algiphilus sp. NNCM1]|uniref:sulfotransferase family protein n=1 Tax=Algiphilus sp. TaxID=1872431 RepID=UPI001CA6ABA0|nr:sulfotransferase [Algiphilus sp.]MBY8965046.1 sulfotransferase [Algiphilus acroporae]MCI5104200.1 sulfotransferase [Algiphilus sp.]